VSTDHLQRLGNKLTIAKRCIGSGDYGDAERAVTDSLRSLRMLQEPRPDTARLTWDELLEQGRRRIKKVFQHGGRPPRILWISEMYFEEIAELAAKSAHMFMAPDPGERDITRYHIEQFCKHAFGVDAVRFGVWMEDTFAVPNHWVIDL
jgi:hypothetical protein